MAPTLANGDGINFGKEHDQMAQKTSITIDDLLGQNADLRQQLKDTEEQVSDLEGRLAEIRGLSDWDEEDSEPEEDDPDEDSE